MQFYENEPQFVAGLIARIRECYEGICPIERFQRVIYGERNDVFFLYGKNNYVIRIIHHSIPMEGVRYINRWAALAADGCDVAVAPMLTKEGESFLIYEGRAVCLYPMIEGDHADPSDPPIRDDMAIRQAQLHRIGVSCPIKAPRPDRSQMLNFNFENNFLYNWDRVDAMLRAGGSPLFHDPRRQTETDLACAREIYERREVIYRAKEEFQQLLQQLSERRLSLTYAPIHGDLYSSNVLAKDHRITGIVDWDECNYDLTAYELARTCFMFCGDETGTTFDMQKAERFLRLYEEHGGPTPKSEYFLMVPMLRMLKYMDIMLYLHNTIIGDTWTPSYGLQCVLAIDRLKDVRFD